MSLRISVEYEGLKRLQRDLERLSVNAAAGMTKVVRDAATAGNKAGKTSARVTAGSHGKLYHKAFTVDMVDALTAEYGPDSAYDQGGMSFETGSINQPPHNDVAKSVPHAARKLVSGVRGEIDKWFW